MLSVIPTSIFTHFAAMVVLPIPELSSWPLAHYSMYSINSIRHPFPACLCSPSIVLSYPVLPSPPLPLLSSSPLSILALQFLSCYRDVGRNFRDVQGLKLGSLQNLLHGRTWVLFCVKACTNMTLPLPRVIRWTLVYLRVLSNGRGNVNPINRRTTQGYAFSSQAVSSLLLYGTFGKKKKKIHPRHKAMRPRAQAVHAQRRPEMVMLINAMRQGHSFRSARPRLAALLAPGL
ncbi:hypothetical protein F5Y10DRAFT_22805 [Nemania abortiva]|nr:hypothetical protein F5Y10DRAFT_22805 [Nemania abortiva]